jgi:Trypsin-like peptidase domain/von Willebrand factor type A domain
MSHIVGTIQNLSTAIVIGPDSGPPSTSPDIWNHSLVHNPAPGGTKFLILHFQNVNLPGNNRLEVELGYDTDVFTSADGTDFWTRPINIYNFASSLVPISYIRDGGGPSGSVQIRQYGRGERHIGETNHSSFSNCDPFIEGNSYLEPTYDPWWYCVDPPNWENVACIPPGDIRENVARSVGMIVSVEETHSDPHTLVISTCTVTLVDTDKVITAGHCHSHDVVINSSITFDYQTNCDGTKPAGYNPRFHKVKRELFHKYVNGFDYSLLQLATSPAGIPVVQFRHDIPAVGEQVFGIHHPNGAVKKLSIPHPGFDTVLSSGPMFINVHSNFHVSGGSSGSGLFDTAGRIVGILSGGAPCISSSAPLKYFPISNFLLDIATPLPPVTRDVMIVFDRSGSMSESDGSGRTKIEAARDAVSLFTQLIRSNSGNRLGMVSFSTAASSPVDFNISPVTGSNKNLVIGSAPFSGGIVGGLLPGGLTSIGDGMGHAISQFPAVLTNPRTILLLTDGLENTPPLVNSVEGSLSGIDVHIIGFGTDSSIDAPFLSSFANRHNGMFSRAENGLALEKFFSASFGNIFETGILMDPEETLPADKMKGTPQRFNVCGEDAISVVAGWNRTDAKLNLQLKTPSGNLITTSSLNVESSTGRTWTFLRIALPYSGERDGTWDAIVLRQEIKEKFYGPELNYFINVIPSGGARLIKATDSKRYYTGDIINPIVFLRFPDESWPVDSEVKVTITKPDNSIGNILITKRLSPPAAINGDTIPSKQETLMELERTTGRPLINYVSETFDLLDDSLNTNGAFESAGMYGKKFKDLFVMEGIYNFHFIASYGEGCTTTRELTYSLYVDTGIDQSNSNVTMVNLKNQNDDKQRLSITIFPRDWYGNSLGPGRTDTLVLTNSLGTSIDGDLIDNGDGSYSVKAIWDPSLNIEPGVFVSQPERLPVFLQHPPKKINYKKWKILFFIFFVLALILLLLLLILK